MVKIQKKTETGIEPWKIPETNIGLVGHVDHGKTTLTLALTGKWTDTHSEEIKRGITIRLGYADATIYKCQKCKEPFNYSTQPACPNCSAKGVPVRSVSFVDLPGHETLMTTVLSGASIMDGALLLISAHERCPQPQTREHLKTLDIAGIKNLIVVQNKIDLVDEKEAMENYKEIKDFLKGSVAENAPIVPISAQQKINIDVLISEIEKRIPTPTRDPHKPPQMLIARSFDINKPGTEISQLRGGIVGGSLIQGKLSVGDTVEIRPGIKIKEEYKPITTKITGLQKSSLELEAAGPGGLLGLSTELDPYITKSDAMSGNILGIPGKLPSILTSLTLKTSLLDRVVGSKEELKVDPIKTGDALMLTVGISRTIGVVQAAKKSIVQLKLKIPVCTEKGSRVAISTQILGRWRLIGWATIE